MRNVRRSLKSVRSAQSEVPTAGIELFYFRGTVRVDDSWKANGPKKGRHGRGSGKRGFGAHTGGIGDEYGSIRPACGVSKKSSAKAAHWSERVACDGGVAASH